MPGGKFGEYILLNANMFTSNVYYNHKLFFTRILPPIHCCDLTAYQLLAAHHINASASCTFQLTTSSPKLKHSHQTSLGDLKSSIQRQ